MFVLRTDLIIIILSLIFVFLTLQIIPQILKNLSTKAVDAWMFNSFLVNENKLGS